MIIDDLLTDRQSDSGSFIFRFAMQALEDVEYLYGISLVETNPIVCK